MKSLSPFRACIFFGLVASAVPAFSQGRGGTDWSTIGNDAQRSSWVRTDPKISAASMQKPGFQFMWKVKVGNDALSAPSLMDRYIGYRGFRSYAFVGGSGNNIYVFDSDLARVEWKKHFPVTAVAVASACPAGMTASVARGIGAAFPGQNAGRGGFGGGRGGPAKSGVGAPGEGAVTIPAAAPMVPPAAGPGRGPGGAPAAANFRPARTPSYLNALSSDGAFHNMYISNGEEPQPPIKFLPTNANATELAVVDGVAYAVTSGNCGGVENGVWALELATKTVTSWKGAALGTAFGPDGTLYVATSPGEVVALESKSLRQKASFSVAQQLLSGPIVLDVKGKAHVAVAAKDGSVQVLDADSLAKVASSAAGSGAGPLATWQDATGDNWILSGSTALKFTGTALETGWKATVATPTASVVVNGVVFLAGGTSLTALEAATGKQVWTSGSSIASPISKNGGLAAVGSTVYLGAQDGTLYAFGFPIEH